MYTIGTAGHVDHGKSALVRALTGIDPDRLAEEKERGMTIHLGFAWLRLPSGREISIVDVPGHERFIKNMLAGVGGIDLAMLVVAADEGVMPQTQEHLSILDLLRVSRGVAVVTKKDLVERDWLDMVEEDVQAALKGTVLASAPIVAVSAVTGEGLPDLLSTLDRLLEETPPKRDIGRPRLPIDRVFTITGFGTVVTGTLIDGRLRAGQEVEVLPKGLRTRIRGLQTHKQKVEEAEPGSRVAANLASLSTSDLQRGDVVALPRTFRPTRTIDAHLRIIPHAPHPLPHGTTVTLHPGSAETLARVSLLDAEEIPPGGEGWAQLRLAEPVVAAKGDLFVIRSPDTTLGGGEVVEPHARRHKRFQGAVISALEVLRRGSPEELALAALGGGPAEASAIAQQTGLPPAQVESTLKGLVADGRAVRLGDYWTTAAAWRALTGRATQILASYHRQFPLREGMPREELKSRLGLPTKLFTEVIQRLAAENVVAEANAVLRLAGHRVEFSPEQQARIARLKQALGKTPYAPPSLAELEQQLGLDPEAIAVLLQRGELVRVADDIAFLPSVYDDMVRRIKEHIATHGKITVAEVRDLFGASRKYALALTAYLDEQRITRRVGDERVLY
ncbi:MAG: selenocysteine-specific translation elongation factor [Chloroflexi bacterium]|nr:selenocysteine-specific translation elongation factor [Chloroflexota bacterium]